MKKYSCFHILCLITIFLTFMEYTDIKELPNSYGNYFVDGLGRVFDSSMCEIPISVISDIKHVFISWFAGEKYYPVFLIVLKTFKGINLPMILLEKVIPLYKDNNKDNLSPSNLLYKFSSPLEVLSLSGFYYIPFNTRYGLSKDGVLINIKTKKIKSWYVTKPKEEKNIRNGYSYSRVVNDYNQSRLIGLHRALCFVFKDYENNVEDMVVNHKDGNTSNNDIENLEWTTYLNNNLHALDIGLRNDNKPIFSKNLLTGEILYFRSIAECGKHYGQPQGGFIHYRLRFAKDKIYPDMLQFKFDDGSEWPVIELEDIEVSRLGKGCDIQAKNVFTGDILIFTGAAAGFNLTGVDRGTIISHINKNSILPVKGWLFRWLDYFTKVKWPIYTERHLRIFKKYPLSPCNGIILKNTETGKELFFEDMNLAVNFLGLAKHHVYKLIKENKIISDKYLGSIFYIKECLGPTIE